MRRGHESPGCRKYVHQIMSKSSIRVRSGSDASGARARLKYASSPVSTASTHTGTVPAAGTELAYLRIGEGAPLVVIPGARGSDSPTCGPLSTYSQTAASSSTSTSAGVARALRTTQPASRPPARSPISMTSPRPRVGTGRSRRTLACRAHGRSLCGDAIRACSCSRALEPRATLRSRTPRAVRARNDLAANAGRRRRDGAHQGVLRVRGG